MSVEGMKDGEMGGDELSYISFSDPSVPFDNPGEAGFVYSKGTGGPPLAYYPPDEKAAARDLADRGEGVVHVLRCGPMIHDARSPGQCRELDDWGPPMGEGCWRDEGHSGLHVYVASNGMLATYTHDPVLGMMPSSTEVTLAILDAVRERDERDGRGEREGR